MDDFEMKLSSSEVASTSTMEKRSSPNRITLNVLYLTFIVASVIFIAILDPLSLSSKDESATMFSIKYSILDDDEKYELFLQFKEKYRKEYESEAEEAARFSNFLTSLTLIDERNEEEIAAGGKGLHGVTKFADVTHDEFSKFYLGYLDTNTTELKSFGISADDLLDSSDSHNKSITTISWVGIYTTPIKDQGYCGSCWAFSATEQIESDSIRAGYLTTEDILSPQEIVSWYAILSTYYKIN
jgi:hypothetical protein